MKVNQEIRTPKKSRRRSSWMALIGTILLAPGHLLLADSSCTSLLAAKASAGNQTGEGYNIELTMHREGVKFVSYSSGFLAANPDGSFSGTANQLFSDRQVGAQVFDVSRADWLNLEMSRFGYLRIHYNPWNFDTAWDLTCQGSVLTTYVPSFGVVTLTFRDMRFPDSIIY